jgi:hypothetical protein
MSEEDEVRRLWMAGMLSRCLVHSLLRSLGVAKGKYIACSYFNNQLNAQFLYSITMCMLHYIPRHVSNINMPIFRRINCIITTSGIFTLCKRLYSMPDESRLQSLKTARKLSSNMYDIYQCRVYSE